MSLSEGMLAEGADEAFLRDVETDMALGRVHDYPLQPVAAPSYSAWRAHERKRCANFQECFGAAVKNDEFLAHQMTVASKADAARNDGTPRPTRFL